MDFRLEKYRELYKIEGRDQYVVVDEMTNTIYVKKELNYFYEEVFEYLKNHHNKHIPRIQEYFRVEDKLIVIEELIQGDTLESLMRYGEMDDKKALGLLKQLCEGIDYLHNAKTPIIHRDLKPSNIMIDSNGVLKIIDYDAAKYANRGQVRDTVLIGTKGYAAPEQYGFAASDEKTDIFALGKIAEEILSDKRKYKRAIEKATSMDPEKRQKDAMEFYRGLTGLGSGSMWPPPGFRTRTPWKIALAIPGYFMFLVIIAFMAVSFIESASDNGYKVYDSNFSTRTMIKSGMAGLMVVIYMFLTIDIFLEWTGIFMNLPFMTSKNVLVRVLVKLMYLIIAYLLVALAFYGASNIVDYVMPLEVSLHK